MSEHESILRALAIERRRIALRCLLEHRQMALADLAELVAEHETGTNIVELSAKRVSRVYHSLYHTHVPCLEDAALVAYDQDNDHVSTTEQTKSSLVQARDNIESLIKQDD